MSQPALNLDVDVTRFSRSFYAADPPVKLAELAHTGDAGKNRIFLRDGQTVAGFEADADNFQAFKDEFSADLDVFKAFAAKHVAVPEKLEHAVKEFDHLFHRFFETDHFREYRKEIYGPVKVSLDTVARLMENENIPAAIRLESVLGIVEGIAPHVCIPGVVGNLQVASRELHLSAGGLFGEVWNMKEKMIRQDTLVFSSSVHGSMGVGNEIHYANMYTNRLSAKFGIPHIPDRMKLRIEQADVEACAAIVMSNLTPYQLTETMAQGYLNEVEAFLGGKEVVVDLAMQRRLANFQETLAERFGKVDLGQVLAFKDDGVTSRVVDTPQGVMIDLLHNLRKQGLLNPDNEPYMIMSWKENGMIVKLQRWSREALFWREHQNGSRETLQPEHLAVCGPDRVRNPEVRAALAGYLVRAMPVTHLDAIPPSWLTDGKIMRNLFSRMGNAQAVQRYVDQHQQWVRQLPAKTKDETVEHILLWQVHALTPLLKAWNRLEPPNARSLTPLQAAAMAGNVRSIRMLIEAGAVPTSNGNHPLLRTPLMLAAAGNHSDAMRLLLSDESVRQTIDEADGNSYSALLLAAQYGGREAVDVLLDAGANTALTNMYHSSPLELAAAANNVAALPSLIAALPEGVGIDDAKEEGGTALMAAAGFDALEAIGVLCDAGAQPDAPGFGGATPLMQATLANTARVIEELVARGAALDATNRDGDTALVLACCGNRIDALKKLIALGADLEIAGNLGTPLVAAMKTRQKPELVAILCAAGANLAATDPGTGRNPMALAAAAGDAALLQLLVDEARRRAAADPGLDLPSLLDQRDAKDHTALTLLASNARRGAPEASMRDMDLFDSRFEMQERNQMEDLHAGFEFEAEAEDDMDEALAAAVPDSDYAQALEVLLKAGADIQRKGADGKTPLIVAAYEDDTAMAYKFCALDADLHATDRNNGQNALMIAIRRYNAPLVGVLLTAARERATAAGLAAGHARGSEAMTRLVRDQMALLVGARDCENTTPLIFAVRSDRLGIFKLLIDEPAIGLDDADDTNWTALMWAAFKGNDECVRLLIERGARTDIASTDGKTARQLAQRAGRDESATLLQAAESNKRELAAPSGPPEKKQRT